MLNRQKRRGAAGAAILLVGAGGLLLWHRHRGAERSAMDDSPESPARRERWVGFEAGRDVPRAVADAGLPPLPDPSSKDVTPGQVSGAMATWRQAILEKHADEVLSLDRTFALLPGRYGPELVRMAETDG